jgi:hypothetical protein
MAREKEAARVDAPSHTPDAHSERDPWLESSGTFRRAPIQSDIRELSVDLRPPPIAASTPLLDERALSTPAPAESAAPKNASHIITRAASTVLLGALLLGLFKLSVAGYYIATDSFVAPIILSPDSDAVLPSKLNLVRIMAERAALLGRIDQADAAIVAANQGSTKLSELKTFLADALGYTQSVTSHMVSRDTSDLAALAQQRTLIEQRTHDQEKRMVDMERQLDLGLLRRTDVQRERDILNELKLATIQNDRDRLNTSTQLHNSSLARRALAHSDRRLSTPEMTQQREQMIRIDIDLLKLEAEKVGKTAELRTAREELGKLNGLLQQVKERPVFRAIESRQNVAFVPYTQLAGIEPGAQVFTCTVWGMLGCQRVGQVTHLLPGEVAAQDPWGSPTRGQYALLQLSDPTAATAKVLRVRGTKTNDKGAPAPAAPPPSALSKM